MMDLLPLRDLIVDEYGNYYEIVAQTNGQNANEVTLVNAFMEMSFHRLVHCFQEDIKGYEWEYVGKHTMEMLKDRIKGLEEGRYPGKIYSIADVAREYAINTIPLYEKNPHVVK